MPPLSAKVGDWVEIKFFAQNCYFVEGVSPCVYLWYDWGDGNNTPADVSGLWDSRRHQYSSPGTYTWSVRADAPEPCPDGYFSGEIRIFNNVWPGVDNFNTPETQGGRDEHPNTVMGGGDGQGMCQLAGLPNYWVNTSTLNLIIEDTLLSYQGSGPPVELKQTYNDNYGRTSLFGKGWRFSYESQIDETCDKVTLTKGSGRRLEFSGNSCPSGSVSYPVVFSSPTGVYDRLYWYGDFWLLEEKESRQVLRYDRSAGTSFALLSSVTDSYGNSVTIGYDDRLPTTITDAAGRVSSLQYNSSGRVVAITAPDGRTASYRYDSAGRLTSAQDFAGTTTRYGYFNTTLTQISVGEKVTRFEYAADPEGFERLSSVIDSRGNRTDYTLDKNGGRITETRPTGAAWVYDRNSHAATSRMKDPLGQSESYTYDNSQNLTSMTDAQGKVTQLAWDGRGNLISIHDPLGQERSFAYDAADNLVSETDPLGKAWHYEWNDKHRLTKITSPLGSATRFTYDGNGRLTQLVDARGNTSSLTFDAYGNVKTVTDSLGRVSTYSYTPTGLHLASFTDARNNTTQYSFDANNRVTSVTQPDSTKRTYTYDCCSGSSTTDENGNTTSYVRDPQLNILQFIDALGNATQMSYDGNRNLTSAADALGQTVLNSYNQVDWLTQTTDPKSGTVAFGYDKVGNLLSLTDQRGNRTQFEYTQTDQLKSVTDALGSKVAYAYDALDRNSEITNARGQEIGFGYNPDGYLTATNYGGTAIASFEYDGVGNLTKSTDSWGRTQFQYNAGNEITEISYPTGRKAAFTYDAVGNLNSVSYPEGFTVSYTYDSRNRLTRAAWNGGSIDLSYDAVGNLLSISRSNGTTSEYSYDKNDRLLSIRHGESGENWVDLQFTRDAAGNTTAESRLQPLLDVQDPALTPVAVNDADQITQFGEEVVQYDADGNLVGVGTRFSAVYDPENRPVSITRDGVTTNFTYDGLGNRVAAERGIWKRRFHYDHFGNLLFETDDEGVVTSRYIYVGGVLLARRVGSSDTFYHFDSRGSTLALTDASGEVVTAYAYDPFGKVIHESGSIYNPFTYVGAFGVMDEGDGLFFMRNRYYEAGLQRFLQKDPIGFMGGLNLSEYGLNNPVDYIDPEGTVVQVVVVIFGVATIYGINKIWEDVERKKEISKAKADAFKRWHELLRSARITTGQFYDLKKSLDESYLESAAAAVKLGVKLELEALQAGALGVGNAPDAVGIGMDVAKEVCGVP